MQREDLFNYFSNINTNLKHINYKIFIKIKNQYNEFYKEYYEIYEESGIENAFPEYNKKIINYSGGVSLLTLILSTFIHEVFFNISIISVLTSSIIIAILVFLTCSLIGLINPIYKREQAKSHLENNLVYSLSYMAVLSSSGMPIEKILERVSNVEDNPPLTRLTKKFLTEIKLLGVDVRTALRHIAEMSPSRALSKQIEGIRTTIITSGDLKTLLTYEVERQLQKKKEKLRNTLNTLVYIGELYVTLMVVTPVLFILMITILSIMGKTSHIGSSALQLNLIVFFGIPVMASAFILLLDIVLGGDE
jgi:archaellum biogenesis protein FlaJ (TadC family)